MAVLAGVEIAVRLHVKRGDDLDARDGNGMTPLMLAASKNKGTICSLLISSGADVSLLDPSGRYALMIATLAGASLAISAIVASEPKVDEIWGHPVESPLAAEIGAMSNDVPVTNEESLALARNSMEIPGEEECFFDLSGWEAEEEVSVPEGDETLAKAAVQIHLAISSHKPIDNFEDWAAFEAFLPERATPLPRVTEEEGRKGIRKLLLCALREGSVPECDVENLCANEDGSRNEEGEALVRLVIGDLGAETDERIETENPLFDSEESERYEVDVADALTFLDNLGSGSNEPMRIYSKDLRGGKLLTAEEETFLARAMEEGKVSALDVLAAWPEGVEAVLAAADRVRTGETIVEAISTGGIVELAEEDGEGFSTVAEEIEEDDEHEGSALLSFAAREFLERIVSVQKLAFHAGAGGTGEKALKNALCSAHLTTRFLSELALTAQKDDAEFAGSLMRALEQYSQARERMVVSNLRLVISFVKRYQGQGLTFDDLVQEGNIGLMKAVDRYDWRKGFRFSTYATWWIRQQASRAVADFGRTIRMPVHVHEKMFRITREAAQMELLNGRRPSAHAVAERLSLPPGRVAALLARAEEPVSLHKPDSAGNTLAANLIDPAAPDPYIAAERTSLIKTVKAVLAEFDQRTVEVITLRFGLDGSDSRTLEETGMHFGVTRERIRQIEAKALRKFAHPSRAEVLRDFLDNVAYKKSENGKIGK
jgi:RNA polymerase primary sigma factor